MGFYLQTIFLLFIILLVHQGSGSTFRKDIFSTKTAYHWIYDKEQDVKENEWMKTSFVGQKCTAVNSQILFRHGARYPGLKDIRKMTRLHRKLILVAKNTDTFSQEEKRWENHYPEESEKLLVDEGEYEHFLLGQRIGTRLKHLFDGRMDKTNFISSSKERCIDSADAFYEGFTESVLGEAQDGLVPSINDKILRFHQSCKRYIQSVERNKTHNAEYISFRKSPEMLKVAESVKQRLGIEHAELDAGELKILNFLCTFEIINFENEQWCHMLNDEEREVLEYHNDMKQYWRKLYGHEIMGQMACPLVQDIFTALDKAVRNQLNNMNTRGNVATFYFGHVETLAPFYAALGLFNDSTPFLSDSFTKLRNRQFKSSQVLPFSANIEFILYKCGNGINFDDDDLVLRMFVNEKPVKIPVCDDYICMYKKVRASYKHHIDECNYDKVCELIHDEL